MRVAPLAGGLAEPDSRQALYPNTLFPPMDAAGVAR